MGVLKQIRLYEIYGGILLICQNTTMQVNGENGLKNIALFDQKHITPTTVVITSQLVRDKPQGTPASVKRIY